MCNYQYNRLVCGHLSPNHSSTQHKFFTACARKQENPHGHCRRARKSITFRDYDCDTCTRVLRRQMAELERIKRLSGKAYEYYISNYPSLQGPRIQGEIPEIVIDKAHTVDHVAQAAPRRRDFLRVPPKDYYYKDRIATKISQEIWMGRSVQKLAEICWLISREAVAQYMAEKLWPDVNETAPAGVEGASPVSSNEGETKARKSSIQISLDSSCTARIHKSNRKREGKWHRVKRWIRTNFDRFRFEL